MVSTFVLSCLFAAPGKIQDPTSEDLYGKTAAEIVRMGHDKWYEFYVDKSGGESTMSMSFAESYFGWALKTENDKTLYKMDMNVQDRVNFYRLNMSEFEHLGVDMGRAYTGGGTLWNPVYSSIQTRVEETVAVMMGGKTKEKSYAQADVWAALKEARQDLKASEAEIRDGEQYSRIKYAEVEAGLGRMFNLFQRAVDRSSELTPAAKGRIFAFYKNAAEHGHQFE